MNVKKNPQADLEKKRFAFLQIGLIVAGGLTLMAFQFTSTSFQKNKIQTNVDDPYLVTEVPIENVYVIPKKTHQHKQKPIIDEVKQVEKIVKTDPEPKPEPKIDNIDIINVDVPDDEGTGDLPIIDTPFKIVEEMPEFPGGYSAMSKFIAKNIQVPEYAMPLEGIVYVRFIVDRDGSITNARILKGIHRDYDNAAINVVKKMPKWKPGKQAGKAVRVQYEIPIKFRK